MAALPTSLTPHAVTEVAREFKTTIIEFETENEQRFVNWGNGKGLFKFSWNVLSSAELNALIAFFNQHKGQALSWTFSDTRIGGAQTLRFNEDKLNVKKINASFANVEIEVKIC